MVVIDTHNLRGGTLQIRRAGRHSGSFFAFLDGKTMRITAPTISGFLASVGELHPELWDDLLPLKRQYANN